MSADRITEDADGNLVVQQSLAGLLDAIRKELTEGFATVRTSLERKADKADVTRLEGRMTSLETRLTSVEGAQDQRAAVRNGILTRREKVWGILGAVALILATTLGPTIANAVH